MQIELAGDEVDTIVTLLFDSISGSWETLKEECDSMHAAAAMYDSWPETRALSKLVPHRLAEHRQVTMQEVALYLD